MPKDPILKNCLFIFEIGGSSTYLQAWSHGSKDQIGALYDMNGGFVIPK